MANDPFRNNQYIQNAKAETTALKAARRDRATLHIDELLTALDEAKAAILAFEEDFPNAAPFIRNGKKLSDGQRYDLTEVKDKIEDRTMELLNHFREMEAEEPARTNATVQSKPPVEDAERSNAIFSHFLVEHALTSIQHHRDEAEQFPRMMRELEQVRQSFDQFMQAQPDAPITQVAASIKPDATLDDLHQTFDRIGQYWQTRHAALFDGSISPEYAAGESYEHDLQLARNIKQFVATYQKVEQSPELDHASDKTVEEPEKSAAETARERIEARIAQRGDAPAFAPKQQSYTQRLTEERDAQSEEVAATR